MSAPFAFRIFAGLGLLVGACSQASRAPDATLPNGQAGAPEAGAEAIPNGGALDAGGSFDAGGSVDAGGAPDAGAANSGAVPAGTGGNVPTAVTWKVIATSTDTDIFATTAVAASRGNDAAVGYVEQSGTTPVTARAVMQRFDAAAERIGPLLILGTDPNPQSNLTLASDGKQYAACWDSALEVHCSLVDEQGHVQLNALALGGQYATIVASPTGWVIAYATSDTGLRLQALTPALEPTGSAVDLQRSAHFVYPKIGTLLTRTPSGFALVGASLEDGHDGLLRLDADLQPLGPGIPLGRDFWFSGQLVASETRAAVSLSAPYGSYLLLLDAEQVVAELPIAGGGKTGMDEAFLLTDGGIGTAWLTPDLGVLRRYFADGHEADLDLGNRDMKPLLGNPEEGTDSYQQLLKVADQTLLLGRAHRYGYGGAIQAARLTFP
jgi:hypothetical protein